VFGEGAANLLEPWPLKAGLGSGLEVKGRLEMTCLDESFDPARRQVSIL
jgi:hypothetical protein